MIFARLRRVFDRSSSQMQEEALPDELITIYQKACNGYVLEQVLWGKALLNSTYMLREPDKAREWFLIATAANYGPAHNMLGRCSQFGWGCPLSLTNAVQHYENAARVNDLWGTYNLGIMTMRGLGVTADRSRAFTLFRKAALGGHPKSMNLLARFTEEGWETPADPLAALDWYRRSAEGGDYRGQHNYATALLGMGHTETALYYWRQAIQDATPDILQAMKRELSRPTAPQAPDLMKELDKKLLPILGKVPAPPSV